MTIVKLRGFPKQIPSLKLTANALKIEASQKETIVFQPSIFRCELLVLGRVYMQI